jgi:hypothetical protein
MSWSAMWFTTLPKRVIGVAGEVKGEKLYRYGIERDNRPRPVNWLRGLFCSTTCIPSYHQ